MLPDNTEPRSQMDAVEPGPNPESNAVSNPAPRPVWQVRLLGTVQAERAGHCLLHWPSRAVAALLARLALSPGRAHPREELVELLWPGVALGVGRNRLRQALSTLKSMLEPTDLSTPVLQADRMSVRVVPGQLLSDAREFEQLLRAGNAAQAHRLYLGEFMPGFYEDWVLEERARLSHLFDRVDALPLLQSEPPAAHAVPEPQGSAMGQLPHHWTRLYGTEQSAIRLRELCLRQRLVTVFGPGGSGKTRLTVHVARGLKRPVGSPALQQGLDIGFDRVIFVSMIDCTEAAAAIDALAVALGIRGQDALDRVTAALSGQRSLLVLDNFEQLAGRMDTELVGLLSKTAGLHLLVSSRQRLMLDGEHVFELNGLAIPPAPFAQALPGLATATATASASADADADAQSHPAMALFVDRARSARPDFQMNAADEAAVIELLHLVSGMPLAIELAASRMRNLAPQALLKLLASGESRLLDVLGRGGAQHNTKQRHASMRHVVDWSWRQLGPELVELMAAMVTFAAPARIEAVAAVAGLNLHDTRERLEQLCDCSLVQVRDSGGDTLRYVLLQPVREFAAERVAPEVGLRARARLRTWLVAFGRDCHQRAHRAITDAQAEMPQIYAAIQSAAADHALAQAVDIALAFRRYWEVDTRAGLPASVTQTLDTARQTLTDPALRCELCVLLCFSHSLDGETKLALALAQEALDLAPDARLRAHALMRWAQVVVFSGGEASGLDATLAQALTLAHDVGDLEAQALALRLQFVVAGNRDDDHVRAEALAFQAQTLWERLGHRRNAYGGLMDRASCWIEQRRLDEAATALATCEQVARQEQHATGYITSSWQLGRVAMRLRQSQGALAAFRRCVHGSWQHLRLAYVADALVLVPGGLALTGQWETAARLQGFAVAHWQAQFGPFYAELERDVRFTRRVLLHCLGATRMEQLRLEGTCLSLPQAVSLALDGKTGQEAAQGGF